MKTKTGFLKRISAVILSLMFVSTALFADGGTSEVGPPIPLQAILL